MNYRILLLLCLITITFGKASAQNIPCTNLNASNNVNASNVVNAGNYVYGVNAVYGGVIQATGKVIAGTDFQTQYSLYAGCVALNGNTGMFGSGIYNNAGLSPTLNFGDSSLKSVFVWHPGKAAMIVGTLNGSYQDYLVGSASYSFGKELKTASAGIFVVGQFNVQEGPSTTAVSATSPLFTVGNGDDNLNRSNAFTVYKDGTIKMKKAQGDISMGSFNY